MSIWIIGRPTLLWKVKFNSFFNLVMLIFRALLSTSSSDVKILLDPGSMNFKSFRPSLGLLKCADSFKNSLVEFFCLWNEVVGSRILVCLLPSDSFESHADLRSLSSATTTVIFFHSHTFRLWRDIFSERRQSTCFQILIEICLSFSFVNLSLLKT